MDRKILTMNYFKMLPITVAVLIIVILALLVAILKIAKMTTYVFFWTAMLPITRLVFSDKMNQSVYGLLEEYWNEIYTIVR